MIAPVGMTRRAFTAATLKPAPPNILVFLADDLGGGDLGCFGSSTIRTPHLDRLAAQGARLTAHYVAAPSCSPSRAAFLAGRYPQRTGVTGVLREEHDGTGMLLTEKTLAEALTGAGYDTALIGKWHLGMPPAYRPRRRGFQHFYGFLNGTVDYGTHLSTGGGWKGRPVLFRNDEPVQETGYLPHLLCTEAERYIKQKHEHPFFLLYATPLPHVPYQVPERWSAPYAALGKSRAAYAGMVAHMDDEAGRLLRALDESGQAANTIVLFFSDNGWVKLQAAHAGSGDNGPLRGGKYELYEGGIRTPAIVRWPGRVKAGSTIDAPSTTLDWFPTLAAAAGVRGRPANPLDGLDLAPALRGRRLAERSLLWSFRDDLVNTPRSYACRRGRWKYLEIGGRKALYDLLADPGEQHDIAAQHPELARQLEKETLRLRRPED